MAFDGAAALVTGGSGGLGRALSTALAGAGADVAVAYRTGEDRARSVCTAVESLGRRAIAIQLDQTDEQSVARAVERVTADLGGLDLLMNNAGMASGGRRLPDGDLDALSPEIWDEMMAVNLRGPYLVTRAAAAALRRSRWGRVVTFGSTIGYGVWGGAAAYAPSKGAVVPLTRFLAAALAPEVTVNCICPGLMEGTEMSSTAPQPYVDGWKARALTGRTTGIEDVAAQAIALCGMETITGQTVVIDGGIHFD